MLPSPLEVALAFGRALDGLGPDFDVDGESLEEADAVLDGGPRTACAARP